MIEMLKFIGVSYTGGLFTALSLIATGYLVKFWYDYVCANMGWRVKCTRTEQETEDLVKFK